MTGGGNKGGGVAEAAQRLEFQSSGKQADVIAKVGRRHGALQMKQRNDTALQAHPMKGTLGSPLIRTTAAMVWNVGWG
eukprot:CAMPEP_0177434088 /NCGR_PEP_ID=MMETSP0369-20130122/221_1 /TAXON_ID=447022 ORGANISM="Scrippsiella hangoei-like, Strain SHHI-4" /NCGR_SAMPLE_ID=MMETSP0369 /ASSEMBLY_ACC=CAM_ASM_000364 /LENGTH=77 /DNA_ID=CAMNT_0018904937 /DNA_START=166 /DNA_END=395 /DNA_ORIENTATION=+